MSKSPAHRKSAERRSRRGLIFAAAGFLVAGAATGGFLAVGSVGSHPKNGAGSAAAAAAPRIIPLNVLATAPIASATGVDPGAPITVSLSGPLAADSPQPAFTPAVAGTWSNVSPTELEFTPSTPLVPLSQETLTIPGGPTGLVGTHGQHLAASTSVPFTVAAGTTLRLQQLLAQLGYLPLSFTPATPSIAPAQEADVQPGTFAWKWATFPPTFTSLWTQGTDNVITRGAVMSFQEQNGLGTDGIAGPQVWTALLHAAVTGTVDPAPYDNVVVNEGDSNETATVYRNGVAAYASAANTGVASAPTATGTFPVYLRYQSATMSGVNPDGSHYSDPGIPWISYFNGGDALHGFVRSSYGFPQSVGCVELPPANAAVIWPMTPIGTLVTVQ